MRWVGMPVRFILALAFTPILFLCACIAIDAIAFRRGEYQRPSD